MEPVTCWYTVKKEKGKTDKVSYNHYEKGWVISDKPTPKFKLQKQWLNQEWVGKFRYIDNNKIQGNDMNSPKVQKAAIDALEELSEMSREKDELEEGPWCAFIKDMQENMKDLDPEISKLVDDHFWELI